MCLTITEATESLVKVGCPSFKQTGIQCMQTFPSIKAANVANATSARATVKNVKAKAPNGDTNC